MHNNNEAQNDTNSSFIFSIFQMQQVILAARKKCLWRLRNAVHMERHKLRWGMVDGKIINQHNLEAD